MNGTAQDSRLDELTTHVLAAETQLTFFARQRGKDSADYRQCLNDFATAWYLLKKNRTADAFHADILGA